MEVKKGYKQTEVGVIPEDWQVVPLADVFTFKNGLNKEKQFFGKGTPIVNYMDVYKNSGIVESDISGRVTLSPQEIKNYEVKKGDVFFTRTSETIEEIGLSTVVLSNVKDTVFSGFVLRARPKNERLALHYKKYCFSTSQVRKEITSKSSYTTRALTNGRLLSNVKIAIPKSTAEQTAIATALSDADALIRNLEILIAKKRNIKLGAMRQLLQPKEDWTFVPLGEYVAIHNGESPSKFKFKKQGVPYFKVEQLNNSNKYTLETPYYVESTQVISAGSIIFPKRGASIFLNKVRILSDDSYMDTNLMALTLQEGLYNEYLYYQLSHIGLDRIADTTSIPQINNKHITPFMIPLPKTQQEQITIANILSDMDSIITSLETKLEKYRQIKKGMMQQLLTGKIRLV